MPQTVLGSKLCIGEKKDGKKKKWVIYVPNQTIHVFKEYITLNGPTYKMLTFNL
jgi:hypothetical protein